MSTEIMMSRLPAGTALWPLQPQAAWTLVGVTAIPLWALGRSSRPPLPQHASLSVPRHHAWRRGADHVSSPTADLVRADASCRPTILGQSAPGSYNGYERHPVSNILFVLAIRLMPAAQANLIVYLLPLEIVLLAAAFGRVSLRRNHLLAVALGFAGAAVVAGPTNVEVSWLGIGLALGSGLVWAIYR